MKQGEAALPPLYCSWCPSATSDTCAGTHFSGLCLAAQAECTITFGATLWGERSSPLCIERGRLESESAFHHLSGCRIWPFIRVQENVDGDDML